MSSESAVDQNEEVFPYVHTQCLVLITVVCSPRKGGFLQKSAMVVTPVAPPEPEGQLKKSTWYRLPGTSVYSTLYGVNLKKSTRCFS